MYNTPLRTSKYEISVHSGEISKFDRFLMRDLIA